MFNLREYREPTNRLPDFLPWAALVAPGVVLQKNAVVQTTLAFRGPDLASSSDSELLSIVARLNNALRRLGTGWGLHVEAQRFQANTYPRSTWSHAAAHVVDAERRHAFEAAGSHFESSYYLTFSYQLPTTTRSRIASFFYDDPRAGTDQSTALTRDLEQFQRTVAEIADIMRGVFPEVGVLTDDQTLTYLHSTISTHRHPVRAPETPMYLDALLPDMPLTPGDVPMLGEHFLPTCTVAGFPGTTQPGILDDLNHLQIEYRWATRFLCLDRPEAQRLIEGYRRQWWQKRKGLGKLLQEAAAKQESALLNSAASNKAADADAALQELGANLVAYGYLTTTVTVWDRDLQAARRKQQAVAQAIQNRGFTVRNETLNAVHAWLGSLPGNVVANVRRPILHTVNLVHMMPVSSVWAGEPHNEHLLQVSGVAAPQIQCSTTGDSPFRLNLNIGDVGHTLILGPTGAGKSTLLGMLALQWLRYPQAQVILFDKDRSARAATLAVGGVLYEPGSTRAALAFQPLAHLDEPGERAWASRFVETLLATQGLTVTHDMKAAIDNELVLLGANSDRTQRTLTVLAAQLGSHNKTLAHALRPYTVKGPFGQIFDASRDHLAPTFWTMIEMGALMQLGEAAVIPGLEYLFHRVEQQFDGRPTLLILDEAWLFLSHPVFASRLQAWLKTLRKKNVYVVFATQEVADATSKAELLSTILSACQTQILLPDEQALTPAMTAAYRTIGLTDAEIHILARAQKKRDYYYRSTKGRRLFRLDLGPAALAFVGCSSEADQRAIDDIVEQRPPAQYAQALLEHRGATAALTDLAAFLAPASIVPSAPSAMPVAASQPPAPPRPRPTPPPNPGAGARHTLRIT
jgi:type IV secretion system protein VirB4